METMPLEVTVFWYLTSYEQEHHGSAAKHVLK
jgi:hypothetical protein